MKTSATPAAAPSTQTGGTNSVTNGLNLAQNAGSSGTYNLSGAASRPRT